MSLTKRHYYIEFVGQHTAGKTSTLREVADAKLLAPYTAVYPQQLRRSSLHFVMILPWLVLMNFRHVLFVKLFLVRYVKWNWINYHAVARHLFKMVLLHPYYARYDFDVWMKDDMLHLLPRLLFKHKVNVRDALRKFFDHFTYRYDGLVYMDIAYETAQKRFAQRFRDRSNRRRQSRIPVYKRSFQQTLLLRDIILHQTAIPVLVLNGTDDISVNARKVAEFIREVIRNTTQKI